MKRSFIIVLMMILAASLVALAQQPTVGTMSGRVVDADGKPLPGATISISGPLGDKALQTDTDGRFEYRMIPAGVYRVKVEMEGFNPVAYSKVGVSAGQTTPLSIKMTAGKTEEVTVTSAQPLVDVKRVEVQTTFKTDQTINTMPIGRNFVAAVAFAPGVVSGGQTGEGNYSIGGSSGLENSYVIDGVNITSSGYGGVGTYSNSYGSLGTGVTSDFLEEVQVKTAGFEAEYGQALGGVITGILKSGTNDIKGRVAAYFEPRSLEAEGETPRISGGISQPATASTEKNHQSLDLGIQAGGPIIKDRLFWFAAYNPTKHWNDVTVGTLDPRNPVRIADPTTASTYVDPLLSPGANGFVRGDRKSDSYAAKLNAVLSLNHRIEATFFGDPSKGYGSRGELASGEMVLFGTDANGLPTSKIPANYASNGLTSTIKYGADQQSLKYTGFFGGEWFVEAQFSNRKSTFEETPLVNDFNYVDRRPSLLAGLADNPQVGGLGFYGPTSDKTKDYALKITKTLGAHELKAGVEYFDLAYSQASLYSGPTFTIPFAREGGGTVPITTTTGAIVRVQGGYGAGNCDPANPLWGGSDCEQAPYYSVRRTRFNAPGETTGKETAFFIQDTWSLSDKWTVKAGLRTSSQKLQGSAPFTLNLTSVGGGFFTDAPTTYTPSQYKFPVEYSPRIGISFDPAANGKTKIFANYARYFERVPADLAVRAFSNEVGASAFRFTDPQLTTRRGATGNPAIQGLTPTCVIQPTKQRADDGDACVGSATKLPYKDEFIVGWQQLLRPDVSLEVRGIYRKQGRVLEDTQFVTVEEIENNYYGPESQNTPTSPITLPFPNYPSARGFGAYVLGNPGENTGSGFGSPDLKYKAFEVQLEKRLSNNWSAFVNYRYAILKGNYEGLFRNDNAQSDPNITSLFDFPDSHLMRGQYQPGVLNNDRPHVLHAGGTYFFNNGFEAGGIFSWQSGTPRTPLLAHPNYGNAGELPGRDPIYTYWTGTEWARAGDCSLAPAGKTCFLYDYKDAPRGSNGRTPDVAAMDIHLGYKKDFRGMSLKVNLDVTNLFNTQEALRFRDTVERETAVLDANYLLPIEYQSSRAVRLSVLWDW